MTEDIRLDSHKLIYHPGTVSRWLDGENIYPVEVEISPSGACNHRCIFCAVDYMGYQPVFLDKDIILRDIEHMSSNGLKSVICSGEGEPLLNKDLPEIVNKIKEYGVDVAMSSNAVFLTKDVIQECLGSFTWIRFSVASMEENSYNKIHCCKKGDLDKVKANLQEAVRYKKDHNLKTTLGVQCLLIPDNLQQILGQAEQLREIGVDYFTVKPYSQHLHSNNHFIVDYNSLLSLEKEIKKYETESFKIYFRANAMKKMNCKKNYKYCYGLPFMTHIDAKGNVWPCIAHLSEENLCFGNIYEQTFEEIWEGERRQKAIKKLNAMDINQACREACRLDEINKYLHELKNPSGHVNFI